MPQGDANAGPPPAPAPSGVGRAVGGLSRRVGSSAGRFLRRQVWAWPLVAAAVLGGVGWFVHRSVEGAMRDQRATDLNVIADATVTAVRTWTAEQGNNVELLAADEEVRRLAAELVPVADGTPGAERKLTRAAAQDALRARLKPRLALCGYVGFFVVTPAGVVAAADHDTAVGKSLTGYRKEVFDRAVHGERLVSRPFPSTLLLADEHGEPRANLPSMYAAGPLRDDRGRSFAALGLRIRPEDRFTTVLGAVRFAESGEVYAFDRTGRLVSESRFDADLKRVGLLADQPDSRSILTVEVRDPGVNMAAGERPATPRADQPLTLLAAAAVTGTDGCDADGHRDYRGVPSVGAWRWLPEYEIGVAAELDSAEAFRPVYLLRRAFWSLIGLLGLSAAGIFVAMLVLARKQAALQQADQLARRLGQYTLEEKIGAGGMGTVYRARHAMLRRPTAVKLLNLAAADPDAAARFEREVQLTSTLTHPNTVAVYDYGRTPDGLFYYAMEYLEGTTLDGPVAKAGPLPEARIVYLLRQVCGALAEAHAAGLVHRDVKPANIFLTRRGGMADFVKLLDFGLAKPLAAADAAGLTSRNAVVGTPHYLSPEAITHSAPVDARADVYAVGAVAYYLLTGEPVFPGKTVVEVCMKHVKEEPVPPSRRAGRPVTPGLEALVLRCLAKDPAARPADAAALLRELNGVAVAGTWTAEDAAAWWAAHGPPPVPRAEQQETPALPVTVQLDTV